MNLTPIKSNASVESVAQALPSMLAHRLENDRYGVVTVTDAEGGEHNFLLQANRKKDDVRLLDKAGEHATVTLAITQDGVEQTVTGKLSNYTKNEKDAWYVTKYLGTAFGGVTAGLTGVLVLVQGALGAELGAFHGPGLAGLGAATLAGGVAAFAKALQNSDGIDWARRVVTGALEKGSATATIKSIESAPTKPVAALPAPQNDLILPPQLLMKAPEHVPVLGGTR